jgi:hypothetical protein
MDTQTTYQLYPTPRSLAQRAFDKFRRPITRLLEPSAGCGDLLVPTEGSLTRWGRSRAVPVENIDCVEIDLANHPVLRDKGYRVVGHDFLKYQGATVFSSILMNPPFAYGAEHVLHAWSLLASGELVAILNAETLRNPCTPKRRLLAELVARHSASAPEYLRDAFTDAETARRTEVEIVLIHLEKASRFDAEFLSDLAKERAPEASAADFVHAEVMLPRTWLADQVHAFGIATKALREASIAGVRAAHYAARLGRSITDDPNAAPQTPPEQKAAELINAGYAQLKAAAWSSVLRSTEVTSRLSSEAQRRLEAQFKQICDLEFTEENVHGFLAGLIAMQGDIQLGMICDVFDAFSRYHRDNRVYFQGWASNGKHRQCGMALRATRIVLPAARRDWYAGLAASRSLSFDDVQRFRDFDKVFDLLSGKAPGSSFGLEALFARDWKALVAGERCRSDYFDARFYPRSGTFHLFPRDKALVDRLNRLVGRQRAWLPPSDDTPVPAGFWKQFSEAERINREADFSKVNAWRLDSGDADDRAFAHGQLTHALQAACAKAGVDYDPDGLLQAPAPAVPLLRAA